jgi:hypothetical protein
MLPGFIREGGIPTYEYALDVLAPSRLKPLPQALHLHAESDAARITVGADSSAKAVFQPMDMHWMYWPLRG